MRSMPRVLLVSKPLVPPWNDGAKNLARSLACTGLRYQYHVLVPKNAPQLREGLVYEPVYASVSKGFTLSYTQKIRVVTRLLKGQADLYHFFFAPNPLSSKIASLCSKLRKIPTIQTVCSTPAEGQSAAPWIFGHRVVVLSQHTLARLLADGVPASRLVLIPPGIEPPAPPEPERLARVRQKLSLGEAPVVLFPGDYEVSQAAETFARACLLLSARQAQGGPLFVFACRAKTPRAAEKEARIKEMLGSCRERVRFAGEVDDMPALLAASAVVALPAESLYAKMDIPLVLLEALALGIPIVVADVPPLGEILRAPCGVAVPPAAPEPLAEALSSLLLSPERRRKLGEAGRALVQEHHLAPVMAGRYEALYDEVLAEQTMGNRQWARGQRVWGIRRS